MTPHLVLGREVRAPGALRRGHPGFLGSTGFLSFLGFAGCARCSRFPGLPKFPRAYRSHILDYLLRHPRIS